MSKRKITYKKAIFYMVTDLGQAFPIRGTSRNLFRSLDTAKARICQVIEARFEVEPNRRAHAQVW